MIIPNAGKSCRDHRAFKEEEEEKDEDEEGNTYTIGPFLGQSCPLEDKTTAG